MNFSKRHRNRSSSTHHSKLSSNRIFDYLTKKGIPVGVVNGDTSSATRLQCFDALQSGTIRVLIAHPQAMAHGITLTNSNITIWWTPVFSHEIYEQANGRTVRPGQVRKTYFVHFTCSAVERYVLKRLGTKEQMQGVLLEYLQRSEN
jgi:SNF2 family DNA or RNA helicase